jgi:hypothetical protein
VYFQGFGGKPECKKPLGRSDHRWNNWKKQEERVGIYSSGSWLRPVTGFYEYGNEL